MERLDLGKDADLLVNVFLDSIVGALRAGDGVGCRASAVSGCGIAKPTSAGTPASDNIKLPPVLYVVYFKLGKNSEASSSTTIPK